MYVYFLPSLRAGGILQILQSDCFHEEREVFYDLARWGTDRLLRRGMGGGGEGSILEDT